MSDLQFSIADVIADACNHMHLLGVARPSRFGAKTPFGMVGMNIHVATSILMGKFSLRCTTSLARGHTDEQTTDFSLQRLINDWNLYTSTLQGLDLDRYVKKLQCLCGRVGESQWCRGSPVNRQNRQTRRYGWLDRVRDHQEKWIIELVRETT